VGAGADEDAMKFWFSEYVGGEDGFDGKIFACLARELYVVDVSEGWDSADADDVDGEDPEAPAGVNLDENPAVCCRR